MANRRFKRYTLKEYTAHLQTFVGKVRFSEVHVHHTYKPTISDYRKQTDKEQLIQAMWRYHTQTRGWQDIAQHVTVDPDGYIWDGRPLTMPPASATGFNDSDPDGVHPFMFEMIGNFDVGEERLDGPQLQTVIGLTAAIVERWGLSPGNIRFHREMTPSKSCPGTGVDKATFVAQVQAALQAGNQPPIAPVPPATGEFPLITDRIPVTLDGSATIAGYLIEGMTYVPLRALAEGLGAKVGWDPASRAASVTSTGNRS